MFFPPIGWMQFDPTPLTDGTTYTPPYVSESGPAGPEDDPNRAEQSSRAPAPSSGAEANKEDQQNQQAGADGADDQQDNSPSWPWLTVLALAVVSGVLTAVAATGRRRKLTLPLAAGGWILTVVLAAALVSFWLALLVVVLLLAGAPGLVRERQRLRRRHEVHHNGPAAATSAWTELLAESADRGAEVNTTETVRITARRLATEHGLDDHGRVALRTVVSEVERSWYGGSTASDPKLGEAFDTVVAGMRSTDPLDWKGRLLPRSVVRRRKD